jgi:hypothetical protein
MSAPDFSVLDGPVRQIRNAKASGDQVSLKYACQQYQTRYNAIVGKYQPQDVFVPQPYTQAYLTCITALQPPKKQQEPDNYRKNARISDTPPTPTPAPRRRKPQREWEAFGGASAGEVQLEAALEAFF